MASHQSARSIKLSTGRTTGGRRKRPAGGRIEFDGPIIAHYAAIGHSHLNQIGMSAEPARSMTPALTTPSRGRPATGPFGVSARFSNLRCASGALSRRPGRRVGGSQRADVGKRFGCLQRLIEESIGAELEAEVVVLGVVREDQFDRTRSKIMVVKRLQYVEAAAGAQRNVDYDQIRLLDE